MTLLQIIALAVIAILLFIICYTVHILYNFVTTIEANRKREAEALVACLKTLAIALEKR